MYSEGLKKNYTLQVYDSCQLAGISTMHSTPEERHRKFITGGIEKAVQNLVSKVSTKAFILGFSIGGTLAWKAVLNGLTSPGLFLISATRLRYEKEKPAVPIQLYYGENDRYRPKNSWFTKMALQPQTVARKGHAFYRHKKMAALLIDELINN